jgi:hypothetical protein
MKHVCKGRTIGVQNQWKGKGEGKKERIWVVFTHIPPLFIHTNTHTHTHTNTHTHTYIYIYIYIYI